MSCMCAWCRCIGGRIDHVLSSLCTLHRHEGEKIILCGDGNLVRLLSHAGIPTWSLIWTWKGPRVAWLPMAAPAIAASSQGLKWNLGAVHCAERAVQASLMHGLLNHQVCLSCHTLIVYGTP